MTTIATKRLELRKYDSNRGERLNDMVRWLNDPEVVRYSEQRHRKHDWEDQLQYILNHPGVFREIHVGDRFIGTISAYIDRPNSVADVGILIGEKSLWGKGYGTEAWSAFMKSLFSTGIRKVEAGTMSTNSGMLRIFQKSKMIFEGIRVDHFLTEEKHNHMVHYGKFNEAV